MAARRDDVLNKMVPSDVRQLVGAIERQMAERQAAEAENTKLRDALAWINGISSPNPMRTFDIAIKNCEQIMSIARAALSKGDG